MKVKLKDGYEVETDERNFILYKNVTGKSRKGEEIQTRKVVGYFQDVRRMFEFMINHSIYTTDGAELKKIRAEIKQAMNDVRENMRIFTSEAQKKLFDEPKEEEE